ncbi:MAG: Oligopeptide transport ATP-binding protein OppD, partial [uncultured Rubrobacteraceae bacterium]
AGRRRDPLGGGPEDLLRHPRRRGAGGEGRLLRPQARRDARHRRRVGERQVGGGQEHHAPQPRDEHDSAGRRDPAGRGGPAHGLREADAGHQGAEDSDGLPGPDDIAGPDDADRAPDRREPEKAPRHVRPPGRRAGGGAAEAGRHTQRRGAAQAVPPPVLRGHAPEGRHSHSARLRPADPYSRRADDRARRDDPGPDPRAHARAAGPLGHVHHPHNPRPRRGGEHGPPGGGDVRRQDRRDGYGARDLLQPPDAIHLGPARLDTAAQRRQEPGADPDPGHPAGRHEPPEGLPLHLPLPLRHEGLRRRDAGAHDVLAGALGRLLAAPPDGPEGRAAGQGKRSAV